MPASNPIHRPDIVLICSDSQGANLLGCYGRPDAGTLQLDRLAASSVSFEHAYPACPLCTPARGSIMTGVYPSRHGAWANSMALSTSMATMGQRFRDAGYHTALIGKWHLDGHDYFGTGEAADGWDPDYWYDCLNYLHTLRDDQLDAVRGIDPEAWRRAGIGREQTWAGGITDRAIDFLRRPRDRPRLLVLTYDEPHHPFVCPPKYVERFAGTRLPIGPAFHDDLADKPRLQRALAERQAGAHARKTTPEGDFVESLYLACNAFVDDEVGEVLRAVDDRLDDPLVIFTSDHGDAMGAHRIHTKGPFMYEPATRVPLTIRAPGDVGEAGRRSRTPVTHVDLLPTMLDYAGLDVPPALDGRSLRPELEGRDDPDRAAIMEFNRFAIHQDPGGLFPIRCIRKNNLKLAVNLFDRDELYDLDADPDELHNRIDDPAYAARRDAMFDELMAFMDERCDPFRGPVWHERPWREAPPFSYTGAERALPPDGYRPPWRDYGSGRPRGASDG